MTCLLSQPLLGRSDPAAWHPGSQRRERSLLPPGAAALLLLALKQTSLMLTPPGRDYGSVPVLPQYWRGSSRVGGEMGPSPLGRGMLGLGCKSSSWRLLGKERRRDMLSAAVQLSSVKHPVLIRTIFYIPIKEKKGLPGILL